MDDPTGRLDSTPFLNIVPTHNVYFNVLAWPQTASPAQITETPIPGGNAAFVDVMGPGVPHGTFQLLVASSLLQTLRDMRSSRANLYYVLAPTTPVPVIIGNVQDQNASVDTQIIDPTTIPKTTFNGLFYEVSVELIFL
jgi:hypothetical protein